MMLGGRHIIRHDAFRTLNTANARTCAKTLNGTETLSILYSRLSTSVAIKPMDEFIDHVTHGVRQAPVLSPVLQEPSLNKPISDVANIEQHHSAYSTCEESTIHPTALIDPLAKLGQNVHIGAYSIIGPDAVLDDHVVIHPHVVVRGSTRIGSHTVIHSFACIGGEPQDKKHNSTHHANKPQAYTVIIGSSCVIREHVTIHACTTYEHNKVPNPPTTIGDHSWILCGAHVAHDACIGSHVVLSNNVCVAGHVTIGDYAIIGGQVGLKQYITIGNLAMVGGGSMVDGDVVPYGLVMGNRAKLCGLNLVGLRRAKISRHEIKLMLRISRYLFGSSLSQGQHTMHCPKTGFAPALDLPYHSSVVLRAMEAKRYLLDEAINPMMYPMVFEIVEFVLGSPNRVKSSLCPSVLR